MSYHPDYTSVDQLEAVNTNSRKDLKKSFEDIDKKLRNLQEELSQHRDRSSRPYQLPNNQSKPKQQSSPLNPNENALYEYKYKPVQNPTTQVSNQNISRSQTKQELGNQSASNRYVSKEYVPYENKNSPIKNQSKSRPETVQDIKSKLRKIFQFYTTFGDRCNASYLKSNKFHKMMLDSGIRDSTIMTQKRLDLIFVAENKHKPNMEFNVFLQLLTKIARAKYRGVWSDSEALNHLLAEHLLPLYENIYNETELGIDEEKLHEEIDENAILILKHVSNTLIKIFQVYFPWESQTSQQEVVVKQRSENALFIFLREFDICPALITKSTAYTIWTEVLDTTLEKLTYNPNYPNIIPFLERDFGTIFTFSKFCAFLIRTAIIAYNEALGPNARKFSNSERFALLLERMELSPGMLNFERKTSTPHHSKNTLIVPREILQKIFLPDASQIIEDFPTSKRADEDVGSGNRSRSEMKLKGITRSGRALTPEPNSRFVNEDPRFDEMNKSSRLLRKISSNNLNSLGDTLLPIFEKYMESLQRIYQYYCTFGEPLNTKGMKSIKFKKLLKECGLLQSKETSVDDYSYRIVDNSRMNVSNMGNKTLQSWEVDIIFSKLTGHRQMVEMNEKNLPFDRGVKSPFIGPQNHLYKNQSNFVVANGKLEFEGWLVAIEQIAERIYPELELEQSVQALLENHILRLDQLICGSQHEQRTTGGQPLKLLVELLRDQEMVQFLSLVHKSMLVYFIHYADSKGLMNFERFAKFCKDFSIFPDILPKSRIMTFFYTLAAIHSTAEQNESHTVAGNSSNMKKSMSSSRLVLANLENKTIGQPENELIDQHLFVEALALCAFEIPYLEPQPSNIEKICYLLERMNQSDGPLLVQKAQGHTRSTTGASWDILYFIRRKYPEIFGLIKGEQKPKASFDDLIKQSIGI